MMRREWRDDITCKEISAHFEKKVDRRMVSDLIEWESCQLKCLLGVRGDPRKQTGPQNF